MIQSNDYDLAILDIKMPGLSGLELLDRVRELKSDLLVVIMTAEASMKNAVEAMKRGAYDYITKPFDLDVIDAIVEKVDRAREMTSQVTLLKEELKERYQLEKTIIGNSPAMREIYKTIGKVAPSDVTVLIQGESGTGKELIARAIHFNSKRLGKPFIALNCAAIPEGTPGERTVRLRKGGLHRRRRAEAGQVRAGQRRHHLSRRDRRHAARPAGEDPAGAAGKGGDPDRRQPEHRRGCPDRRRDQPGPGGEGAPEGVPGRPLLPAERGPDPCWSRCGSGRRTSRCWWTISWTRSAPNWRSPPKQLHRPRRCAISTGYCWPGNIRELENTIKRAVILSSDPLLTIADFPGCAASKGGERSPNEELSLEGIVDMKLRGCFSNMDKMESGDVYAMVLEQVERPLIRFVLEKTRGNQVKAADILGINRNTLRKKIRSWGSR